MSATATNKKPGLNLGKLSAVAQIAVNKPAQSPNVEIELSLIFSVKQVRKKFRNLEELAESFKLNGIIEPLVLHAEADGRYRIIVGERRYRAAPLADLTKVPVIIKRGLTELQIRRIQVAENNDRDDLAPFEEAMGVIEDVELYGTQEAIAIWNRGESWVSKRMAVKRYSDPVRELLENDLCGDFEVLHSLNQLYDASAEEFGHMARRLKEGLSLSRDEARNKVSAVKAFKKQEAEFAKRRIEMQAAAKQEKTPKWLEEQRKRDAEKQTGGDPQGTAPAYLPSMEPSADEVAATERARLEHRLKSLRAEAFEWGDANLGQFSSMKTKLAELGYDMNETEWVLWSGFLSMVLPMMHALGDDRALSYIKRLQTELKTKTPILMWREQHSLADGADPEDDGAPRNETPAMPADWRF